MYVDGSKVAEGYIPRTEPFGYSADEGWNVGADHETPVSEDYKEGENKFTGKIKVVTVETFPADKKTAFNVLTKDHENLKKSYAYASGRGKE
jgi:arylsulfatase